MPVLLDDERPPERDHEEDAEGAADRREEKDDGVLEVIGPVRQEEERRHREDDARRDRFARRPDRLDDVVLEDRGFPELLEDRDREHGDRHRGGHREPGPQREIDSRRAEDDPERRAEKDRLERELRDILAVGRDVGLELLPFGLAHPFFLLATRFGDGRESAIPPPGLSNGKRLRRLYFGLTHSQAGSPDPRISVCLLPRRTHESHGSRSG